MGPHPVTSPFQTCIPEIEVDLKLSAERCHMSNLNSCCESSIENFSNVLPACNPTSAIVDGLFLCMYTPNVPCYVSCCSPQLLSDHDVGRYHKRDHQPPPNLRVILGSAGDYFTRDSTDELLRFKVTVCKLVVRSLETGEGAQRPGGCERIRVCVIRVVTDVFRADGGAGAVVGEGGEFGRD